MRKILLSMLLTGTVLIACSKKSNNTNYDKDSAAYFIAYLKADMNYTDIVNQFGNPDGDIGSGIHIYYYDLNDGTKIYIGYVDKILYARHVNSNGQLIHTII